ncbi:MAG: AAA family ATPase [Bdellovibrionales bacterium]
MSEVFRDSYKYTDEELDELFKKYCTDFTANARNNMYDPITGRDREIQEMILILLQKGRKNVMLQAPAGVGKTAMCVGLAQQIVEGNVPDLLKNARLMELDLASMAAGTSTISEFQGRLVPVLKGVGERSRDPDYPKIILFLDEVHQIMPTCEGSSYKGLSEVMKPYLTSGSLNVIGATTKDEYRMYIGVDPAMDRRFQKVDLTVPTADDTFKILQNLRPNFIKHHKLEIPDLALRVLIHMTEEYMKKRNQPDKSIMTLDSACAWQVMNHGNGGELKLDCIYKIIERETAIHANALALTDEKIREYIAKDDPNSSDEDQEEPESGGYQNAGASIKSG